MTQFLNQHFSILTSKRNRWVLACVMGIYGVFFMNVYVPFNVENWPSPISYPSYVYLSAFGIVAFAYVTLSQVVLKEWIIFKPFQVKHFIVWTVVELLIMGLIMMLFFGETYKEGWELIMEYGTALKQTVLVGIIPYGGTVVYLNLIERKRKTVAADHLVKFKDSNGDLKLVVALDQLLFLKSADNYVEIYFHLDGQLKKELIRTTLKILEQQLIDMPIERCQRSFMVNINRVSVLQKSSQGFSILLNGYDDPIPVSKNYKRYFLELLDQAVPSS